jgi:hypothetical protein
MKNVRESNEVDVLLNAVLADEDWQELNLSLKHEALAAIGAQRRRRYLRRWTGRVACAALLLAGAGWWWRPTAPDPAPVARISGQPASPGAGVQFISEEEMLAMFPPGSCVVAEVNGEKELVFFDAKKAEEGFVSGGQ